MSTQLDLTAIRKALADQIRENISSTLRVYAHREAAPVWPAVIIGPGRDKIVGYHASMAAGASDVDLLITILVPRVPGPTTDETLDRLLSAGVGSPASIVDAVELDKTLGDVVQNCVVSVSRDAGLNEWPGTGVILAVAEIDCHILVKRSV
jgi:hypothetical protein